MSKALILVQARMGSSRFPNKMTAELNGHEIISWVLKRLKQTKLSREIVLVTTKLKRDEVLCRLGKKLGVKVYTGSEKNVLSRFFYAAKKFKGKEIVRVCADNPFVDPKEVDRLIRDFDAKNFDYAFNNVPKANALHSDGFGAEILTYKSLEYIFKNSFTKNHKEHVTSYIWNNKNEFKIQSINSNKFISYPELKFDVDKKNDLIRLNNLVKKNKINFKSSAKFIVESELSNIIQYYLEYLFPICRSITGAGNRKTLKKLKEIVPLKIKSIKSGEKVYDWKVPKEWNIKDAYISDLSGKRLIDFNKSNLHVVNYSLPVNKIVNWNTLKNHLFFDSKNHKAIPYRTTYYKKSWGFCVTKKQWQNLKKYKGKLKVFIDSSLNKGKLDYAELLIPGKSKKEILISTYFCHPSMANDSLSGTILTAFLARHLKKIPQLKWTYRIIFVPETIGAISYLNKNEKKMKDIDYGLNITTVGGKGQFSYKKSFDQNHFINRNIEETFKELNLKYKSFPFDIHGSDERQYSTQGFSINVATIAKDKYYEYKEYHTSLDNLKFVNGLQIFKSLNVYVNLIHKLESRKVFQSKIRFGEPMLSKYNLYPKIGGALNVNNKNFDNEISYILWILFLSDGKNSLNDISKKLKISKIYLKKITTKLVSKKLLTHV